MAQDITQELMQDAATTFEAVFAAVLAQHANANAAAADASLAVTAIEKTVKDAVNAIPNIPDFAKSFLESDMVLVPCITNLAALLQTALVNGLVKLESGTFPAAPPAAPAA